MALGAYAQKFTTRLDKIIERETLTSDLNMNGDLLGEFSDSGEIKVATIAMDGLANYDRATGFVDGEVTTDWETYKLRYDRGRAFSIDAMDDEERAGIVSANVMAEFERTKVIPEVDAIRFATLAANAGETTADDITTADAAYKAVATAEEAVEDAGVDLSTCLFYCTSTIKRLLRENQKQNYRLSQGENPNGNFLMWDEMKIVTVPTARFQSKITLLDGTTEDQEAGGFTAADDALALNFMIVHPSAAAAIQRHKKLRYFSPDTNQKRDAHLWQYRLFHDLLVYQKQKAKIYAHTVAAKSV
nr:MAG: coat protein [Bacteriophage sp.]